MKKGEKSIVIGSPLYTAEGSSENSYPYNCPKDQKTTFIVELMDFYDKEKEKWDYSKEERVPVAAGFKEEGTKAFKAKDMNKAKEWYEKAIDYLDMNDDEEAVKLASSIRLNLSLIYCKEGSYDLAIEHADKAIKSDEKNLKALFRRAQANYAKKDY
jgi:tetratricopeptide (TPR) repeat protein